MKALCWHGKGDGRVDKVPDPKNRQPRDITFKLVLKPRASGKKKGRSS